AGGCLVWDHGRGGSGDRGLGLADAGRFSCAAAGRAFGSSVAVFDFGLSCSGYLGNAARVGTVCGGGVFGRRGVAVFGCAGGGGGHGAGTCNRRCRAGLYFGRLCPGWRRLSVGSSVAGTVARGISVAESLVTRRWSLAKDKGPGTNDAGATPSFGTRAGSRRL